jgi:hypothetical protein
LDDHWRLLAGGRVERFAYSEIHWKDKEQLRSLILTWLSLRHDVLLRASGSSAPISNVDRDQEVEKMAQRFGLQGASHMVAALQRTLDLIDRNVNARLAVDVLLLDMPSIR